MNDMVINTRKGENSNKYLIYATEYVLKKSKISLKSQLTKYTLRTFKIKMFKNLES